MKIGQQLFSVSIRRKEICKLMFSYYSFAWKISQSFMYMQKSMKKIIFESKKETMQKCFHKEKITITVLLKRVYYKFETSDPIHVVFTSLRFSRNL